MNSKDAHCEVTKANTVLDFAKGDQVYILSEIKKKKPGPVTIADCRGTVTGMNKNWVYIATNSRNNTHRLAHNI